MCHHGYNIIIEKAVIWNWTNSKFGCNIKVTVCFKPLMINDSLTCKCEVNYETVRPKKKNPNTWIILLFTLGGLLHVATNYHSNILPVFILITFTEITYPMKEISGM